MRFKQRQLIEIPHTEEEFPTLSTLTNGIISIATHLLLVLSKAMTDPRETVLPQYLHKVACVT